MGYEELCKDLAAATDEDALALCLVRAVPGLKDREQTALVNALRTAIERLCRQTAAGRSAHSERLEAIGKMAAAISHELRNPLSGIKITAEYLIKKLHDQPEVVEIITNIHSEVMYANTVISNILEHAKVLKPQLEQGNIVKAINEALLTVAQQGCFRNIDIEKDYQRDIPLLMIDPIQMRQLFMNLFMNAAEAMLGGGTLTITIHADSREISVQVKDTGTGISPEQMTQLFEPFYTTKAKGIGLGLSVVKEMIDNHTGRIEVESKKGKGTIIVVHVPRHGEPIATSGPALRPKED